ncbi:peroxidase family protein [Actinomycetospora soli]|uniref:peroxidase family protein n=1 Tax=Actinomycetospora soli TaxID=2893887 RepID=UPI001E41E290|nr:heme peroxidase family protein [Actinomycetospora soli]MCD2188831.1 heme peroxidase family protein [Actinomycetospora soli]
MLADRVIENLPDASGRTDVVAESVVAGVGHVFASGTPFGYLFPDLADRWPADHLPTRDPGAVVAALKALGSAMVEGDDSLADDGSESVPTDPRPGATDLALDSTITPIYTYWGQFIDHDITANTDRDDDLSIVDRHLVPASPKFVADHLQNLREPSLNLDSLYGDGPEGKGDDAVPFVGARLLEGKLADAGDDQQSPTIPIPPISPAGADRSRDLPRHESGENIRRARIGDGRNDENLIVAQLHTAFLLAHNRAVNLVDPNLPNPAPESVKNNDATFVEARRLLRWTYQWLVRNDFLVRLVPQDAIDAVEEAPRFVPTTRGVYMPLEFSVAAYRFGHSMVRSAYDWNRNFGDPSTGFFTRATFDQLFQFTGGGGFINGADTLPDNWPAEWDRLVDVEPGFPPATNDESPARFARKIDTRVAFPLDELRNEGNDVNTARRVREILKRLAVRNLLRGYKLAIPTGQAVAREYGLTPLSSAELLTGTNRVLKHALTDGEFLEATPLWFYVLKEAELSGGDQLGPLGGRIVAETLIGQLKHDSGSYLAQEPAWDPRAKGVAGGSRTLVDLGANPIGKIADLLRFAGVL